MTPQEFVAKWRTVTLTERAASQSHFNDLCALVHHPTPVDDDPTGTRFTFEAGADKQGGGKGWADVWKKGFFAWEYKGKHANLDKAYDQLLKYRESLQNPPLLIVSDIDTIVIHTNFTNTIKRTVTLTLNDLLTAEGRQHLRTLFWEPERFKAPQTTEQVTQQAAQEFARLSAILREEGHAPNDIAHFLIRLLFCLFAEDIELLPKELFTRLIGQTRRQPHSFAPLLAQLFRAMATGGWFGVDQIRHFNGGLFDDDRVLALSHDALNILEQVSKLDWSSMEPTILGTLFERSLDPNKRSQLGAHYTSREDILLIVEPVLMTPLRRRWAAVQTQAWALAERRDSTKDRGATTRRQNDLRDLLQDFAGELAVVRVLDPACGSANFLYVALKQLLGLWKEISVFAGEMGLTILSPLPGFSPSPEQLYGIEINPYAHQLAQATVWIGYIQWLHENGYGIPSEPILKPLNNIKNMDAILAYDAEGKPIEPEWPVADVIIGNPPFLGGKKLRSELGDHYVESIFSLYGNHVRREADLVCYWLEHGRSLIESDKAQRVGLIATNSIRGGANRETLARIRQTGNIFMAWSDRPWVLNGASVRVSIIGFDTGLERTHTLDGKQVSNINSDLTSAGDLTLARPLTENQNIVFMGDTKGGAFDIPHELAMQMLSANGNPNGRPNSDVVLPWVNGLDIVRRPRWMWIIDFGTTMPEEEAALYESPFEYIRRNVMPKRMESKRDAYKERWWIHMESRPGLRRAIGKLNRYIATPAVARHRLFVWLTHPTLPDHALFIFACEDDYFFGVLHSKPHELWSLRMCTYLGVGNDPRYTPTTTFVTFPFPWPPGQEPTDDPRVQAIAQAAKDLVEKRDNWLNPPGLGDAELKKRTLTNLYNQRPTWLDLAHKKLDKAVLAAYGWSDLLTDDGINEDDLLARLLALNLERAKTQPGVQSRLIEDDTDEDE